MIKNLFILISVCFAVIANAQISSWQEVDPQSPENPFAARSIPLPQDSKGNKYKVFTDRLEIYRSKDTLVLKNFPVITRTNKYVGNLSVTKNDRVAFMLLGYDYVAGNNQNFVYYIGMYDGMELKFVEESQLGLNLAGGSGFSDVVQSNKYIWFKKGTNIVRFDRDKEVKVFGNAESKVFSYPELYSGETDHILVKDNKRLFIAADTSENLSRIIPASDTLEFTQFIDSTNTLFVVAKSKIYLYTDGKLTTAFIPKLQQLGNYMADLPGRSISQMEFFSRNLYGLHFQNGVAFYDSGKVYSFLFSEIGDKQPLNIDGKTYLNAGILDNGAIILGFFGWGTSTNYFFSYFQGQFKLEYQRTGADNDYSSSLYKERGGDFYLYSLPSPNSGKMRILKNNGSSYLIDLPVESITYLNTIKASSKYLWFRDNSGKVYRMNRNQLFIRGKIFYDSNKNGLQEPAEPGVGNYPVVIQPLNYKIFPAVTGEFAFAADPFTTYTMQIPDETLFDYKSRSLPYTFVADGNNFVGISLKDPKAQLTTSLSTPRPRCNTTGAAKFEIRNSGFVKADKVKIQLTADPVAQLSSAVAVSKNGNTLIFEVSDLPAAATYTGSFEAAFAGAEHTGEQLKYKLAADLYAGDVLVSHLEDSLTDIFRCSFDPNDKSVTPVGVGEENYTLRNSTLSYLIRFENTGNDTAMIVTVYDTLDTKLDLNTFKFIGSSHPVITEVAPTGVVRFTLDKINLPDNKTNKEEAQGWIRFSIKTKTDIQDYSEILNKAEIVFDKNQPVITNLVKNTIVSSLPVITQIISGAENIGALVHPNPANEVVFVKKTTVSEVEVYNAAGELITVTKAEYIRTVDWKAGMYLFRCLNEKGIYINSVKVVIKK